MFNRRHGAPLDTAEMSSPDQRKAVFREMGRDLVSLQYGDKAATIARLMEKAFRAGVHMGRADPSFDPKKAPDHKAGFKGYLTKDMIPPRSREALQRLFLFAFGEYGMPRTESNDLGKYEPILLHRGVRYLDESGPWFIFGRRDYDQQYGPTTIAPLQRLGLLVRLENSQRIFDDDRDTLCLSTRAFAIFETGEAQLDEPVIPIVRMKSEINDEGRQISSGAPGSNGPSQA